MKLLQASFKCFVWFEQDSGADNVENNSTNNIYSWLGDRNNVVERLQLFHIEPGWTALLYSLLTLRETQRDNTFDTNYVSCLYICIKQILETIRNMSLCIWLKILTLPNSSMSVCTLYRHQFQYIGMQVVRAKSFSKTRFKGSNVPVCAVGLASLILVAFSQWMETTRFVKRC